jgi:hypothetical protein
MTGLIPAHELEALKREHPCDQVARQWVALRRGGKLGLIGPCPMHSRNEKAADSTSFECNAEGWVCASCEDGGDVIKLVMLRENLDFREAVARLGGTRPVDAEEAKRAEAAHERLRLEREAENNEYRERERRAAWDIWRGGRPIGGTAAEDYLRLRGLTWPADVRLKFDPYARYYVEDRPKARLLHTGSALLARIQRGGQFKGVHRSWFDLAQPKGKAVIVDPKTGAALNSKKMRGSKKGCHIDLTETSAPHTLILGEGIEKVLAIWTAMQEGGRDLAGVGFWTSADLGNLGGKAAKTVAHPTLKTPTGRARRVGGPEPDLTSPAIEIPPSVTRLVLLADTTSDRFLTECTLARAAARYARPGLEIVAAWGPAGADFDDLLRETAVNGLMMREAATA